MGVVDRGNVTKRRTGAHTEASVLEGGALLPRPLPHPRLPAAVATVTVGGQFWDALIVDLVLAGQSGRVGHFVQTGEQKRLYLTASHDFRKPRHTVIKKSHSRSNVVSINFLCV